MPWNYGKTRPELTSNCRQWKRKTATEIQYWPHIVTVLRTPFPRLLDWAYKLETEQTHFSVCKAFPNQNLQKFSGSSRVAICTPQNTQENKSAQHLTFTLRHNDLSFLAFLGDFLAFFFSAKFLFVWRGGPSFQGFQNEKSAQRGSVWDGYRADIRRSFARMSRVKTSVRALKTIEIQAFWRGHPWPESADFHNPNPPNGFPKGFGSDKLWAEFSFPKVLKFRQGGRILDLFVVFLGSFSPKTCSSKWITDSEELFTKSPCFS